MNPGFVLSILAVLVGIAGAGPKDAVLVGAAGEIWARDGAQWRRRDKGGVAATLASARGSSPTDVWALGGAVPPYRHDGKTWSAVALRGGATAVLSTGGVLAVAAGRRVHVRGAAGKWAELPLTARGTAPAIAVWASGPRDVLMVTADGALHRFAGKWQLIATSGRIAVLLAGPTGPVYAAPDTGGLVRVDKNSLKALTIDAALGTFTPRLASAAGKSLYLVGDTTVDGKQGRALAKIEGAKVKLVEALPDLAAADDAPVALIVGADGAALVASRAGTVLSRASGGGWTTEQADPHPAADGGHVENPPARTGSR